MELVQLFFPAELVVIGFPFKKLMLSQLVPLVLPELGPVVPPLGLAAVFACNPMPPTLIPVIPLVAVLIVPAQPSVILPLAVLGYQLVLIQSN